MPNVFSNPDMLAAKSLEFFDNQLVFAKLADRQWESKFAKEGAKIGDTLRLRKSNNFTVREGNAFSAQNITEETLTLRISQPLGVDFIIDNSDMALTIDQFEERYTKPALRTLANRVDRFVAELYREVPNATGTYNTAPSVLADLQAPGVRLRELGVPEDELYYVLDPDTEAIAVRVLSGLFHSGPRLAAQYEKGHMGQALGAEWRMAQNVQSHTNGAGAADSALVNGAGQTGATLNIDGVTASTTNWARQGDLFTIANVNAVNPITGQTLNFLRQFVVTANASSDSTGAVALPIYPSIATSGARQTVDAGPADNAALTLMLATASVVARQPILMHRNAFALAIVAEPPVRGVHSSMTKVDPDAGIGIRYVCWYDGDTNQFKFRYDVLCGRLAQLPDWACRIHTS